MIKNIGSMQSVFNNIDTNKWAKKADIGQTIKAQHEGSTGKKTSSFGDFLAGAIGDVNKLQTDANKAIEQLAAGKKKNIHEVMLAVERADIAFKAMNQIRMKVLEAYKEVMRTQV